jgi:hypothetical protein
MNITNPAEVFELANTLALPGWLWLIVWMFLPRRLRQKTRYFGLAVPVLQALLYGAAALVYIITADGNFGSLDGVLQLFSQPGAAFAGWVHFLSFDLLVGWCIAMHAVRHQVNRLLTIPCLLLTFMAGPLGFLLYGAFYVSALVVRRVAAADEASAIWQQIVGGQPALAQCGLFLLLITPVLLIALLMDTRTVLDVNVWTKPLKFSLALIVYTLTLSWYACYLSDRWRTSIWFKGFASITVAAIMAEMIWLVSASAIGERSHFNVSHAVLAPVYPVMGIIAVTLTAQALVIGVGLLRHQSASLLPLTRYSLAYGLIATFVLTVPIASYLASSPANAVLTAASAAKANALPLTGLLREAGVSRVAHFLATHAMHVVPLAGWFVARTRLAGSGHRSSAAVAIGLSALYSAGVLLVFIQAL